MDLEPTQFGKSFGRGSDSLERQDLLKDFSRVTALRTYKSIRAASFATSFAMSGLLAYKAITQDLHPEDLSMFGTYDFIGLVGIVYSNLQLSSLAQSKQNQNQSLEYTGDRIERFAGDLVYFDDDEAPSIHDNLEP